MPSTITGTAVYRERIALPPGAVFEATLQDIARAGAPAITIGRTTQTGPMPPIRFEIPFDPADLSTRGQYSVRATIHVDGRLRFTTDTVHPVLQTPEDTVVEVHLRAVSQADLTNTYWRINRLQGETVELVDDRREPHIILREVDGQRSFSATMGCNRFNGSIELEGHQIRFLSGAGTLMACPSPLAEMESALLAVMSASRSWRIAGEDLSLLDEAGTEIAHFSAVYF